MKNHIIVEVLILCLIVVVSSENYTLYATSQ